MNQKWVLRATNLGVAGVIAVIVYAAVIYFAINNPSTWNFFSNKSCDNPFGGAICSLAGVLNILFKIITIGLPVAILLSGIYLRLVQFSVIASFLIPLCANIFAVLVITYLGQQFSTIPLEVLAGVIPIMYMLVGILGHKITAMNHSENLK